MIMTTEHQDWSKTIINKKREETKNNNTILSEKHTKIQRLDNCTGDEGFHHETVSRSVKLQIQKARLAKKMNQKQLADAINVNVKMINEYECGKAIPTPNILNNISRVLGVKIIRN